MVPPAEQPALAREQAEALHDEIDRLPRSFRLPVVLCYFEGLTLDEAARRLRWPGRDRPQPAGPGARQAPPRPDSPRRRLARRRPGRGPRRPRSASASVSSPLCDTTTRAAIHFAAGQAAAGPSRPRRRPWPRRCSEIHAAPQAETHRDDLAVPRRRRHRRGLPEPLTGDETAEPKRPPAVHSRTVAAKPDDAKPNPAPGRMFVVGRVLDPKGKPVPGATVDGSCAELRRSGVHPTCRDRSQIPIGDARADGSGRFRIDAPRTSSSRHEAFGAVALAPGYGVGWVELDPDDDQPAADITLRPEQVIHGRLFDLQGRPVPDVTVSVSSIGRDLPQAPARDSQRASMVSLIGGRTSTTCRPGPSR